MSEQAELGLPPIRIVELWAARISLSFIDVNENNCGILLFAHNRFNSMPSRKLTSNDVINIFKLYTNSDISGRAIARQYNITSGLMTRLLGRKSYKDVNVPQYLVNAVSKRTKFHKISMKIGEKHHFLTYTGLGELSSRGRLFKFECECGKITESLPCFVMSNHVKSCGCYRETKNIKTNNPVCINAIWLRYQTGAVQRKYQWNLSKSEFEILIQQNCFYCDLPPQNLYKSTRAIINREFRYNGIDRKDNSVGYNMDNVVTCCGICNIMKGTLNKDDFLFKIDQIYSRRKDDIDRINRENA